MYQNQEYKSRFRILKGGLISLVVASNLYGVPSGGVVTSGTANISQNGNTTNINQSTNKASINWQDFSIKNGETVNFNQPNQNSITLNRVVGNEKSIIDGALNANGQVWLLNSNGTLFGKNAKVNTSGLLVTTKNLKDQDFQNGNYNFKGDSKNSIENLGYIDSKKYASFIANSVINSGEIKVHSGTVNLIGASEFSVNLDDNSNISLKVNKGVLDALVENNNLIIANSGNVYLTTNAKNELLKGVVNNSGIIEANSLDHITGEVILFAHGGTANIDGEIKAKNSFVETSGDKVKIKDGFKVSADKWLIDPTDFTIAVSGGDISGTTLSNNLSSANVEIESTKGAKVGKGDIYVNDTISWSTNKTLTLNAQNDIFINKSITANHNNGKLALKYGQASTTGGSSDYYVNAKVNLKAGGNFSTQRGNTGTIKNYIVITNLNLGNQGSITVTDLQGINGNLNNPNANYVLGSDINASATSSWNVGYGFNPIGNNLNKFAGTFDGLGHTISNLYINGTDLDFVGLFGVTNTNAVIKNIGLKDVNITGQTAVGGLVGINGGTISNSYATGTVNGNWSVGGLVGINGGTISNSYATGTVSWLGNNVGGLVGFNNGIITNSYATNSVTGSSNVGGLVGNNNGTITNSWYDKDTNQDNMSDSATYGKTKAEILEALKGKDGWITGVAEVEGYGKDSVELPQLKTFYKPTNTLFEGGFGTAENPYTITNWTQLQNINNSNILTKGYYLSLINNLSSSTSDYTNFASSTANSNQGFNPIGNVSYRFNGTFDGLGHNISDLYINRPTKHYVGLFGYINTNTVIKNIGLKDVNITGTIYVGGLVGSNTGTISNSYITGLVSGIDTVGGLVGINNEGTITNSYATGTVNGIDYVVGGLVGDNRGTITNSYATVSVTGTEYVGGLAGYNYKGTIENSYASGTVTGSGYVGGLAGDNSRTISSSFYDNTKYAGAGVGGGYQTGVTGLTTAQMSYGGSFSAWDIIADSSVTSLTPILKYDSVNDKYVWAIAPLVVNYNLGSKSTTYNGLTQNLSSFYNSSIFGTNYNFISTTDYKFQVNGTDVTGYKNAGTYSNIKVASTNEFLNIANSGNINIDGTLTINKKAATVTANSDSKVYNGQIQSVNGFTVDGLVNNEQSSVLVGLENLTTSGTNAGTYNTNLGLGTYVGNYNLTFEQGKLVIAKA
ncbi:GLUG motif-containing protein, partial [Arcobacter sp. CECT 9188]|uniref:two-partner secretion domain-containing protein n=1 Tax=Arcobacter sp. CECT 9188 TaxID=2044505 RepID=UPI000DE880BA